MRLFCQSDCKNINNSPLGESDNGKSATEDSAFQQQSTTRCVPLPPILQSRELDDVSAFSLLVRNCSPPTSKCFHTLLKAIPRSHCVFYRPPYGTMRGDRRGWVTPRRRSFDAFFIPATFAVELYLSALGDPMSARLSNTPFHQCKHIILLSVHGSSTSAKFANVAKRNYPGNLNV